MPRTKDHSSNDSRRRRMILFIHEFKETRDYSPNVREIGSATRITSTSMVRYYLNGLRLDGLLDFNPHEARTVRLTKSGKLYVKELLASKSAQRSAPAQLEDNFKSVCEG